MRVILLLGILFATGLAWSQGAKNGQAPKVPPRPVAPAFEVRTLEGTRYASEDLRGSVVVLYFWSTQCRTCLDFHSGLDVVARQPGFAGAVTFLALAPEEPEEVSRALQAHPLSWAAASDTDDLASRLRAPSRPSLLILDAAGGVAAVVYPSANNVPEHLVAVIRAVMRDDPIPHPPRAESVAAATTPVRPPPAIPPPAPLPEAIEKRLKAMEEAGHRVPAQALRARLESRPYAAGRHLPITLFFGRIVLEGEEDRPDEVSTFVEHLSDGWFVISVRDPVETLSLRHLLYQPLDVDLRRIRVVSGIGDLGELRMRKAKPDKAATLKGRLVREDGAPLTETAVTLQVQPAVNRSMGYLPGAHRNFHRLAVEVSADGAFEVTALATNDVWLRMISPGAVSVDRRLKLPAGKTTDLGKLTLERPRQARIRWVASNDSDFTAPAQTSLLRAGDAFRAEHPKLKPHEETFRLDQQDGQHRFRITYGPTRIYRVGPGGLDPYRRASARVLGPELKHDNLSIEPGTYLLRSYVGYWVLFDVEPVAEPQEPGRILGRSLDLPPVCSLTTSARGGTASCPEVSLLWDFARAEADLLHDEERARFVDDGATERVVKCRVAGLVALCARFDRSGPGPRGIVARAATSAGEVLVVSCRAWAGEDPLPLPCARIIEWAD